MRPAFAITLYMYNAPMIIIAITIVVLTSSPLFVGTAVYQKIVKEKEHLQEELAAVKHKSWAKDQQIFMLEQELQAKLKQKRKWIVSITILTIR